MPTNPIRGASGPLFFGLDSNPLPPRLPHTPDGVGADNSRRKCAGGDGLVDGMKESGTNRYTGISIHTDSNALGQAGYELLTRRVIETYIWRVAFKTKIGARK